jgi:cell division protein FtsL
MKLFKALAQGGPVGLAHAVREAWIAHRIRQVITMLDQETALHRENQAMLNMEMNRLLLRQANAAQRAATYWRGLSS